MSKQNAKTDNGHITAELVRSVDAVLIAAAKHTYSASGVYGAHNQVFKKNETPDTCASCLRNRVDNLRRWYADYAMEQANKGLDQYGNKLTVVTSPAPAANVSRETITDVNALFTLYGLSVEPADEKANIEFLLSDDAAAKVLQLKDEETQMLQDRLAAITAPPVITVNEDDLTKGLLTLKNKAGETVVGTFDSDAGTLVDADGKSFKPGTYTNDAGDKYAVQPGGNTTFKPNDDIL